MTTEVDHLRARWEPAVRWPRNDAPRIYDAYPLLFAPAFPEVSGEPLDALVGAMQMLAHSLFVFDAAIDEAADVQARATRIGCGQSMQLEAIRTLASLFPPASPFWDELRACFVAYVTAIRHERELPLDQLDEETALAIARGKTAVAGSCVLALGILADRVDRARVLVEMLGEYYVARQLWDDLTDWRTDLAAGQPSLLLARAVQSLPPDSARDAHTVGATLYYGGHADATLALATAAIERAGALLAGIGVALPFGRVLDELSGQVRATRAALADMVQRKQTPASRAHALPEPERDDVASDVLWSAARWLAAEAPRAFAESRHWMRFPRELGSLGLRSALFQSGDIFSRALIADALCDLPAPLAASFAPVIEHEAAYILASKADARCGWRYLPELLEKPADADMLAQVLQVAVRTGRARREDFDAPIAALTTHPDGSFETWIVPPAGERDEIHERQAALIEYVWGLGADPEVMANLLYALALWDAPRFADTIAAGCRYLLGRQHANGVWTATWYCGPFYSTYVHIRLLARAGHGKDAVARATDALLRGQGNDGAWSYRELDRPLDTAHAILALIAAAPLGVADGAALRAAVVRGLEALRRLRRADGSWSADPFILVDCGRAQGVAGKALEWGSRTLTTAYALKAAALAMEM